MKQYGPYAFLLGVVIAILLGLLNLSGDLGAYGLGALVLLGIIVGILNIGDKELKVFLIAAIALMLSKTSLTGLFGVHPALGGVGDIITSIVTNLAVFIAPAALVVALKAVYAMSSEP